jgi:fatty-acid peroxygenase
MVDLGWRLFRQGYDAVANDRVARSGGDNFESRLLGSRAVVVRSVEGARAFYDQDLARRRDAVHGLDAPEHGERKQMFLDVLAPDRFPSLPEAVESGLREQVASWTGRDVTMYDELVRAYGRAVLAWTGVPLGEQEADARSRQFAAIVDGFGFAGLAYARGWRARVDANRWAAGLVQTARAGRLPTEPGTVLDAIARSDLPPRTAGIELLNVLRPTVAVAWLGTFAALRLTQLPSWRTRLANPQGGVDRLAFAQEVRRTTPFVPALAGRVRRGGEVAGIAVKPKDRLILDVIGINHDPARWPDPEQFNPDRFLTAHPGPFDLVPQGGGSPESGHRCPGESVALCLLDVTLRVLATVDFSLTTAQAGSAVGDAVGGDVAAGLYAEVDRTRMPTLPKNGLTVRVPGRLNGPRV